MLAILDWIKFPLDKTKGTSVPPGAQSDSELSPHVSQVNVDRGYTSDSEVYTEHSKARIPRSTTDVDVASSGWLVVSTCTRTSTVTTLSFARVKTRMPHSLWTFSVFKVGKDDLETMKTSPACYKPQLHQPLVNQYSLTLGQDLGQHDTKSLIKCVETLSFIVRDAAHVTPDNFELCVRAIRVFVEASLNGGKTMFFISPPGFGH